MSDLKAVNPKASMESIEKYQELLRKDPQSKAFAALVEAYRELGLLIQAERIGKTGIQRHPDYTGGLVAYGRVLLDLQKYDEALPVLKKATSVDSQNILAWQLLASLYVQISEPKEALKAYKMLLFLNPNHEKAKQAVQKLETLTADEYEADVFEMKPPAPVAAMPAKPSAKADPAAEEKQFVRELSLVDAWIVRNEVEKARQSLQRLQKKFPDHPELLKRWELVAENDPIEESADLHPVLEREEGIRQRKIQVLEDLLQRIKSINQA